MLRFGLASLIAANVWVAGNVAATAQEDARSVTCKGALTDVWLRPKDKWPLAVIYDRDHDYTCTTAITITPARSTGVTRRTTR